MNVVDLTKVKIRNASFEDCDIVFQHAKAMATSFIVDYESFVNSYKININDENALVLIADYDGENVGYLLGFDHHAFYANGRVSWVEELFVERKYRKYGIGEKLMRAYENWSVKRKSKLVGLATRRAADFYRAIGYEESAIYFRKLLADTQ